jgi:hypothetical protein
LNLGNAAEYRKNAAEYRHVVDVDGESRSAYVLERSGDERATFLRELARRRVVRQRGRVRADTIERTPFFALSVGLVLRDVRSTPIVVPVSQSGPQTLLNLIAERQSLPTRASWWQPRAWEAPWGQPNLAAQLAKRVRAFVGAQTP